MEEDYKDYRNSQESKKKLKSDLNSQRGEQDLRERSSMFETEINAIHQRYMESKKDKISKDGASVETAVARQ